MRSQHRIVLLALLVAIGAARCSKSSTPGGMTATGWTSKDLGPGRCVGINTKGQIVGVDASSASFLVTAAGSRTMLGTFASSPMTIAVGIDDSGVVAGYADSDDGRVAVRYAAGTWTAIAGLHPSSAAIGIGTDGSVAGMTGTMDRSHVTAFLQTNGAIQPLPLPANLDSIANAALGGRVVGSVETASGDSHAFRIADGKFTDLGTLGGKGSTALGLNARGDVVGASETSTAARHAFLVAAGTTALVDLGLPAGAAHSDARGIDATGRIAGNVELATGAQRAYVFQAGAPPVDITPGDGTAQPFASAHAAAIAADGRIVGWGVPNPIGDGAPIHCLLWTPGGGK